MVYDYIKIPEMNIIHDDMENYLINTVNNFDFIYLDTWADVDPSRLDEIVYLKNLAQKTLKNDTDRVICWGENVVRKATAEQKDKV